VATPFSGYVAPMTRKLALLAALAVLAPAGAQESYPNRPVKIIAPQAPGGGVDLVARIIAEKLRVAMGQPFVVERVPEVSSRRRRRHARGRTATR